MENTVPTRVMSEMKAEPLDGSRLERWLSGRIPRRILVVPFGGPIPSPKAPRGVDLDGEWFSERTDLTGDYSALKASRQRIVDWHHDVDPTGRMKGAILGRIVLDEQPEDDGYWADFWANAGERRLALVRKLEERGAALYGSSQAATKKADAETGEITYWPLVRHTITTSPQNTNAVVPPLKAIITEYDLTDLPGDAIRAAVVGLRDLEADLRRPSRAGDGVALAGLARATGSFDQNVSALLERVKSR